MFYVKTQLTEETTLTTEITDENVFTRCPRCGSEISVDLADILADGDFKLHAKIVGELLCKFIIQTNDFAVDVAVNQRGVEGTDAQFPPLLNGGDTVFGFTEPGDRRPEGHCQQQRNNADEQIINL